MDSPVKIEWNFLCSQNGVNTLDKPTFIGLIPKINFNKCILVDDNELGLGFIRVNLIEALNYDWQFQAIVDCITNGRLSLDQLSGYNVQVSESYNQLLAFAILAGQDDLITLIVNHRKFSYPTFLQIVDKDYMFNRIFGYANKHYQTPAFDSSLILSGIKTLFQAIDKGINDKQNPISHWHQKSKNYLIAELKEGLQYVKDVKFQKELDDFSRSLKTTDI